MTGNLNPEIRKILEVEAPRLGLKPEERNLFFVLTESKEVYSEITSSHRWYDDKTVVVKIGGKYIQFEDYHITGDDSAEDMGLEFDLDSVKFCEPYTVTITKYRPIEE